VRDAIQRVALTHPYYGYRRITAELRRAGYVANHKRVLRLMRVSLPGCAPSLLPGNLRRTKWAIGDPTRRGRRLRGTPNPI